MLARVSGTRQFTGIEVKIRENSMNQQLTQAEIDKNLSGFSIPPRPKALVTLCDEMKKDEPDPQRIARQISSDVGLSAAVLKMVNSPFFGIRSKISSVAKGVNVLGIATVAQIVTGLMLRNAVAGNSPQLERFWNSAEKVACIASHIAASLPRGPQDDAYTFGLFHNVGIPIMMQRFPEYQQTLQLAAGIKTVTELEEQRHAVNHATIGYLVAKAWFLPPAICEGIQRHHDLSAFNHDDGISPQALTLISIICLAEHFEDRNDLMGNGMQWEQFGGAVLQHLGMDQDEYEDLREQVTGMAT